MLSFEERDLARRMRELGARIVVPETPRRRSASVVPLLAAIAALVVVLIVLVAIVRSDDTFNTASPSSPSPRPSPSVSPSSGVIATPTPSHRATPYGGLPPQLLPSPGPTYTISGTITQLGPDGQQHPVPGARIDVWVGLDGRGYHWMGDRTDIDGRYELWGIPRGSRATLYASSDGSLQPCAHQIAMFDDESEDIEIVPSGGAAAAGAAVGRGARLRPSAVIYGQVFERGPDGARVAVSNAMIWVGGDTEPVTATTIADSNGNYVICGIADLRHEFIATAPGFSGSKPIVSADANGVEIDFEMIR